MACYYELMIEIKICIEYSSFNCDSLYIVNKRSII